jgi:hypothetical protein
MRCPNCGAPDWFSPLTQRCELCGYAPEGPVAVETPSVEAMEEQARQELEGRFHLDEFLGRGARSLVFLAREPGSESQVVVKVHPREGEDRDAADERFRSAVKSVSGLEHPHIVPVSDFGWTEHLYWYAMQHVRGRSLRTLLRSRGPLDVKACLRLVSQVASALDYAHRRGLVHASLKPENVLIDAEGWVHVCDLLVSRALETAAAAAPKVGEPAAPAGPAAKGSPYLPPEDLRAPQADQYALGVLVYECLTGAPPAEPEEGGAGGPAPLLSSVRADVPAHVAHAVRRAISPKPVDRFPGVLDFVAALETPSAPVAGTQPAAARPSATVLRVDGWEPPSSPFRRRLILVGALAGLVVLAVVGRPIARGLLHRSSGGGLPAAVPNDLGPILPTETAPMLPPGRDARRPERRPGAPSTSPSAAPGRLFVNATPWGQLYVDGRLVGNTPKANISVSAGTHRIRVVRDGYEPVERTILVPAGQDVRLTDIVLVERTP